jgi:misacylated tRNA(Ala) deacylase
VLVPAEPAPLLPLGTTLNQALDWDRRQRHMRVYTALHLLSAVVARPVTGGAITADKGRLDFDMPGAPGDREALERTLNDLIARDFPVTEDWISKADPDARRDLANPCPSRRPAGPGQSGWCVSGQGRPPRTCNPAAAPMWRIPAGSARCASARSRRRAGRTAASTCTCATDSPRRRD